MVLPVKNEAAMNAKAMRRGITPDGVTWDYPTGGNGQPELKECLDLSARYESLRSIFGGRVPAKPVEATAEMIKAYLVLHGFRQLILNVTEECNLRCRYCVYSDWYPFTRGYSRASMTFATARKAVDYYLGAVCSIRRRNPRRKAVISFYGGEPLLCFSLIEQVVEYVAHAYPDLNVMYNLTTNGTVVSEEIAEFLAAHRFAVSVSLDGPSSEHDRNRVYPSGKGTFVDVMKGIQLLQGFMNQAPEFLNVIGCYDPCTDLNACMRFFDSGDLPRLLRMSPVAPYGTNYYSQFSSETLDRHQATLAELARAYDSMCESSNSADIQLGFLDVLCGEELRQLMMRSVGPSTRLPFLPYTGACVPGDKLSVTVSGDIHMCERIGEGFVIGHIDSGLDYDRIAEIVNCYNRDIAQDCADCEVSRLCYGCYAVFAENGSFRKPEGYCLNTVQLTHEGLSRLYSILEVNPARLVGLRDRYEADVRIRAWDF
ncbi:MAG: radical SAM protein [Bacillota bacterium]|nr:radical SAM protein [Bacillota bacterium]